jgi:hypothetical protein
MRPTVVEDRDRKTPRLPRGHVPQCSMRRVMIFVPDALYDRLLTAAWARKRRRPSEKYSVGAVVREVLEAVLPPAVESIVAAQQSDEK